MDDASLWHLALRSRSSRAKVPTGEVPSWDRLLSDRFLLIGWGLLLSIGCKLVGGSFTVLLFSLPFKRFFPLPRLVLTKSSIRFWGLLEGDGVRGRDWEFFAPWWVLILMFTKSSEHSDALVTSLWGKSWNHKTPIIMLSFLGKHILTIADKLNIAYFKADIVLCNL